MNRLVAASILMLPIYGSAYGALVPTLRAGSSLKYRVDVLRIDYSGNSTKESSRQETGMPFDVRITSASGGTANLEITSGPLFARGRSVGRAKTTRMTVDRGFTSRGYPPSWLSVPLPPSGVKVGQTWRGILAGPSPLPAGISADYRYVKNVSAGGKQYAQIDLRVSNNGAAQLRGSARLFLRMNDGLLSHGSAKFELTYIRPGKPGEPPSVNSRTVLACTVVPN